MDLWELFHPALPVWVLNLFVMYGSNDDDIVGNSDIAQDMTLARFYIALLEWTGTGDREERRG